MNPVTQHDPASLPNAEWHGGMAEHGLKVRGISQGVKNDSPELSRRAKNSTARSVLIWLALWMLPLLPVLSGTVLTADDLGAYHLPLRSYYQSALQAGENWTWCPWIFGGYHLHGEGQIGGDHPLHQLLYRALPLHWAFGIECWWAYPATFFGMWWWLRQMRFSTGASQVAAIAFSLCGYMTLRVVHTNAVQVIAHLPWLLGCLTWLEHRARRSTSLSSVLPPIACSALFTGSQLLLGYPQYVVFTLIAESLWAASLFVRLKQSASTQISPPPVTGGYNVANKKTARIFISAWIAAKGIGLLLGASQVLPTLEYLLLSGRVNWTSEQMFEGSWPLLNLTQLVAPYLFTNRVVGQNTHELTIFMGTVPVCLAVLGLVNRPRHSLRVVKGFAVALSAVGLLLALGEASPLASVMPYIPVWNRFRFPCRATLLLCLGIVLLAALGWQSLVQCMRQSLQRQGPARLQIFTMHERKALGVLVFASSLLTLIGMFLWRDFLNPWHCVTSGLVGLVIAVGIIALIKLTYLPRHFLFPLIAAELLVYAVTLPTWQELQRINDGGHSNRVLALASAKRSITKTNPGQVAPNWNIAPDLFVSTKAYIHPPFVQIQGYSGVRPARKLSYDAQHLGALRAAGVNYQWTCTNKVIDHSNTIAWSLGSLTRGTLVSDSITTDQPAERIEAVNLNRTALVESDQNLHARTPNDHLQIQLTDDPPGFLAFALKTNRDAVLVTTESFHPGWHACVDGMEMPTLRVNGDFLGVRVPPSAQRVECYFYDNWHAVGRWVSLGSLGLLGLVLCLTRMRQNAPGFVR